MSIYKRSILLLFSPLLLLFPSYSQIASINRALLDDVETITVFFETPQSFTHAEIDKQFAIQDLNEDASVDSGKWRLSADGYQLSYSPVKMGSYKVTLEDFKADNAKSEYYIYVGRSSEAVKIIGRGPLLPLTQSTLPIESIGTDKIDIEFFEITNPAKLFERFYIGSDIDRWELDNLTRELEPAGIFRYNLPKGTPTDRKTEHRIPVDSNIKPGAYIVTVSAAGKIYKELDTRILFISDIGLHARRYENRTLIMANYFSTTYPVTDAKLEIWSYRDKKLNVQEEHCSFREGLCLINRALKQDEIVVVTRDGDRSILPMREMALDLNDFPILGEIYHSQVAHIYSNRQLYRPGETIRLNTLLRDDDGNTIPAQNIELRLIDPEGKIDQTHTLSGSVTGFYQTDVRIDNDAKRGNWRAEVRTDPSLKRPNGELLLHIEEFMPERMELILKPTKSRLLYDEMFAMDIESRYLFGAPANLNQSNIQVSLDINKTPFIDHNDWYVGSPKYDTALLDYSPYEIKNQLDTAGELHQRLSLPFNKEYATKPPHVISTFVDVNILDGEMTGINRRTKADFWPQSIVPVVRPLFKMSDLGWGSRASFELFAADNDGNLVSRDLRLTLRYRSDWCTWIYSNARGWDCHRNDGYEIQEMKTFNVHPNTPYHYEIDPNLWGDYELVITDVESGFETIYPFEASWNSSNDGQLPAAKPLALNLKPNQLNFREGDSIELEVDAPFDGFLTMLVEGDEPLYNESYEVRRGINRITLPLYRDWSRHDLYLTGLLLANNSKEETRRALGILPIALDRSDRRLSASLAVEPLTRPESPLEVAIKVDNPLPNEELYATISVTDQGILNMTPTKPIHIYDAFFKQRRYNVDIIDYYNRLFKDSAFALLTPQFGGDGEVDQTDDAPNLTEMKTVSLTSDLLTLDKNGNGTAQFSLPDFNGEAKVVAKVFSKERLNETEQSIIIRAPIIADLVTPNFIRVGDQTHLSLSLHNMSGAEDEIKIALTSDEITIDYNETITLADQASRNILIPMSLDAYIDHATLELSIDSTSFSTERQYRMGTIPFSSSKIVETARTQITPTDQWKKPDNFYDQFDRFYDEHILISRHPIIDIQNYTDNLFGYPYGCTEQTTSRAFPWLFPSHPILDQEKKLFYQTEMERKENNRYSMQSNALKPTATDQWDEAAFNQWQKEILSDAITRIIRRQNSNGGFSLWSSSYTNSAITAYATDFLYQAAQQYPDLVPLNVLEKATAQLKRDLTNKNSHLKGQGRNRFNYINDIAYASWILTREGKIFSADLTQLNQNWSKMSPLSRAYLAAANFVAGDQTTGIRLINEVDFKEWDSYYGYFYTNVAEIALSIDLLNQLKARGLYNDPQNIADRLLKQLNQRLKNKNYYSTQERYALIRLGVELPNDDKAIPLMIDGKQELIKPNHLINARSLQSLKSMENETLYLQYQIEGYPDKKITAKSFDIGINRTIENLSGNQVNVGDRFLVTLTIKPKRNVSNALIVDQIPGGFRLVNPNLLDEDIDHYYGSFKRGLKRTKNLHHEEFRFNSYIASLDLLSNREYQFAYVIEAQTPGHYELPSTLVESMYIPSLRAVKAYQGTIDIRRIEE